MAMVLFKERTCREVSIRDTCPTTCREEELHMRSCRIYVVIAQADTVAPALWGFT